MSHHFRHDRERRKGSCGRFPAIVRFSGLILLLVITGTVVTSCQEGVQKNAPKRLIPSSSLVYSFDGVIYSASSLANNDVVNYGKDTRGASQQPIISPERNQIAYLSYKQRLTYEEGQPSGTVNVAGQIWLMTSAGEGRRELSSFLEDPGILSPTIAFDWLPNGRSLMCLENSSEPNQKPQFNLYEVTTGGKKTVIATWQSVYEDFPDLSLSVSPSGGMIAYLLSPTANETGTPRHMVAVRAISAGKAGPERIIYSEDRPQLADGTLLSKGLAWLSDDELLFAKNDPQFDSKHRNVPLRSTVYKLNVNTGQNIPIFQTNPGSYFVSGPTLSPEHQSAALGYKDVGAIDIKIAVLDFHTNTLRVIDDKAGTDVNWSSP